jgi:hypothetical protein
MKERSMSPSHIFPTVGRVVWYFPPTNAAEAGFARPDEGTPCAAIIARVWSDAVVNLTVFDANGAAFPRTSVYLVQDGEAAPEHAGHCEWMPFQKGQAKAQTAAAVSADDAAIEKLIVAKGKTAPRVTPADIEANVDSWWFFTAAEGVEGAAAAGTPYAEQPPVSATSPLRLLTFCVLVLKNGFTVTGESACASPENFDAEIGRKIARENAVQKIWPLMGYALKQRLHDNAGQV